MKKTRLHAAMAAVAVAGLLAACSGGGGGGADSGPISLRMLTWTSNPDQLAVFDGLANEFMAQHPDVTEIRFESVASADMPTVISTQLLAGDPPDISWLGIQDSRYFIEAGVLKDLTDVLQSTPDYDFDDLIPTLYEDWTADGQIYGVPMSTSGRAMYYNADLFAAAGVPNPNEMIEAGTYTWENFADAVKTVSQSQGKPGYVIGDGSWSNLVPFMYAYGASPWTADASECAMESPEMVEALSLVHRMIYQDKSAPPVSTVQNFWGGDAAAISAYLSSAKLLEDATFQWGIAPTPGGPAGSTQQVGQTAFVVFESGKNADVAADFLAFLTTKESAKELAQFFAPARTSLLTAATMHAAIPILTEEQLEPLVAATSGDGKVAPVSNTGGRTSVALDGALDAYFFQPNADVREAMTQICEKLTPALFIG